MSFVSYTVRYQCASAVFCHISEDYVSAEVSKPVVCSILEYIAIVTRQNTYITGKQEHNDAPMLTYVKMFL